MSLPRSIPIAEIERYLPHRPPMVWIDEVLEFSAKAGRCLVRLKANDHCLGPRGLRATSCLEFIAQAYGFISVCHHIYILDPASKPLTKAFLASIKNTVLPTESELSKVHAGDELIVTIDGVRELGPIVMFKGRIDRADRLLCKAEMKVFKEYAK